MKKVFISLMTPLVLALGCVPVLVSVWLSWILPMPNMFVFVAYALIIFLAFAAGDLKEKQWVFWVAFAMALLRFALSVYPAIFDFSMSWPRYYFVLRYVETSAAMSVALLCSLIIGCRILAHEGA